MTPHTYVFEVGPRRCCVQAASEREAWAAMDRFAPLAHVSMSSVIYGHAGYCGFEFAAVIR